MKELFKLLALHYYRRADMFTALLFWHLYRKELDNDSS